MSFGVGVLSGRKLRFEEGILRDLILVLISRDFNVSVCDREHTQNVESG